MAVLALFPARNLAFTPSVHPIHPNEFPSEASLQLFCGNASLFDTCTESEDPHV